MSCRSARGALPVMTSGSEVAGPARLRRGSFGSGDGTFGNFAQFVAARPNFGDGNTDRDVLASRQLARLVDGTTRMTSARLDHALGVFDKSILRAEQLGTSVERASLSMDLKTRLQLLLAEMVMCVPGGVPSPVHSHARRCNWRKYSGVVSGMVLAQTICTPKAEVLIPDGRERADVLAGTRDVVTVTTDGDDQWAPPWMTTALPARADIRNRYRARRPSRGVSAALECFDEALGVAEKVLGRSVFESPAATPDLAMDI